MEWESCKNYFCINQYRAAELFRHSLEMNHSYSYNYDLNYNYDSFHVHFLLCICLLFRHMDVPSVSISVKSESRRNLFEDDPAHLVRLVSIRRKIFRSRPSTLPQCGFHPHTEAKATFFSGTYQCSVLRRCDPVPKAKETLEDDPVAITKSLYMKVTIATLILVLSDNTKTFKPDVRFS